MNDEQAPIARLLTPFLQGWKVVVTVLLVTWIGMVAAVLIRGPRHTASASLMTVQGTRTLPMGGLAASLLGNLANMGMQITPGLAVQFARLPGVLEAVGEAPAPGDPGGRIVDRLARRDSGRPVRAERVVRTMRRYLTARFDGQTGVVTLHVIHRDSALARAALDQWMEELSTTYRQASQAQARQTREGQERRVDSALQDLRAAEQRLVAFLSRNRQVQRYSPEYAEEQALQRGVLMAERMYEMALADRGGALAKELEETPAVVVIDGPPAVLPREPRGLTVKLLLSGAAVVLIMWLALLARDAARRGLARGTPEHLAAVRAVSGMPGGRRLLEAVVGRDAMRAGRDSAAA